MSAAIAFLVNSVIEFGPDSWRSEPCPGSELAVTHVAHALATEAGADVEVVCRTRQLRSAGPVRYRGIEDGLPGNVEVAVHVRGYWDELARSPGARRILWLQDTSKEVLSLGLGSSLEDLRHQLLSFDALVFPSEWARAEMLAAVDLSAEQVRTLVSYQPLPELPPHTAPRSSTRLIHTAHPRKALPDVLEAWRHIREASPDAELVLSGHPAIYQERTAHFRGRQVTLPAMLSILGLEGDPRIRVLPESIPQGELLALLATAGLLLHPDASTETGATTVLEGMAMGAVPVTSDLGCLPELCDGRGLVVEREGDDFQRRFAEAVVALLEDRPRRAALSERAAAFARDVADAESVAAHWLALLEDVRRSPSQPTRHDRAARAAFKPLDAADVAADQWSHFLERCDSPWFTHTQPWYLAERDAPGVRDHWFAMVDGRGELAAIVPASRNGARGPLVSGLFDPAGPCLRRDLTGSDLDALESAVIDELADRASGAGAPSLLIKLAGLDRSGMRAVPASLVARLRRSGYAMSAASLLVCSAQPGTPREVSRRTRTQIRRAREAYAIREAESQEELRAAYALYRANADRRGTLALSQPQLAALRGGSPPRARLYVAEGAADLAGFAVTFEFGSSASLFAWGVDASVRGSGLAAQLINDVVLDAFANGMHHVECGGSYGPWSEPGMDEFYRRIGARRVETVLAARSIPTQDRPAIRYALC